MKINRDIFRALGTLRLATPGLATGRAQGERRSPYRGRGVEFADYRPYSPGYDLRYIDWNVYGRLKSVLVRLFHEDRNLSVQLCVDASASMGFGTPRKLDHAGELGASLALLALLKRDRVVLGCAGGRGPKAPTKGQNTNAFAQMLRLLEATEPGDGRGVLRTLKAHAGRARSDRLFFLSDMLYDEEAREEILRQLVALSRQPVLLHCLGDSELTPDLSEPLRAEDAETGEVLDLDGGARAARRYADALAGYLTALEARCKKLRVQYVRAFTTVPARDLLTQHMPRARVVTRAGGSVL